MENFDIVLALSRMALNGDEERLTHQITRLRNDLNKSVTKHAEKLDKLLGRQKRRQDVAPMALEQMRARRTVLQLPGETLSRSTPPPTDRETGAPLVRLLFPDDCDDPAPILHTELEAAISDQLREWDQVEDLARMGVKPNMRCLIYGAPGVGKTLLARFIGYQLRLPIVEARLDGLVSSFLGTTARNIGALFDFADRYRCILFLDEFDAIAKARDDSQEVGEIKRVVNTLLQCLDARNVQGFTLAATNHEHLLDSAVWRRFESRIHIPKPESSTRAAMLKRFLAPIHLSDSEMRMLVWLTKGMSGADLETLITGGKRYLVLHTKDSRKTHAHGRPTQAALLSALKRQATLNALLFDSRRQELLLRSHDALLEALIESAGLTQTEAASVLGVSQSTISRRLKSHDHEESLSGSTPQE
ncbi:MAG: AAA family ATPase [Proteobacteria bacterium]|nr:AAA family ATPase [Pseudomonadota bacterium]